jgi:hypothetical protein
MEDGKPYSTSCYDVFSLPFGQSSSHPTQAATLYRVDPLSRALQRQEMESTK